MKKRMILYIVYASVSLFQILPATASEKVNVMVSILPQTYFVRQIGGDLVNVICMIPEGSSPHIYEPTSQQMKFLSKADMYVRIKIDFENAWWEKMTVANPDMLIVDSTQGIEFIRDHKDHHDHHEGEGKHHDHHDHHEGEGEHHEGKHQKKQEHKTDENASDHKGRNPHIWLSPRMAKIQAEHIYQGLITVDPGHQKTYQANKTAFLQSLDALDNEIRAQLAKVKTRKFMVFHPAWSYFARDYGLEQFSIEMEGKEPSAREMAELMMFANKEKIAVIFVQPQASRRSADTIARQIGAEVKILDPLAAQWMKNMRRVAKTLAETLSK